MAKKAAKSRAPKAAKAKRTRKTRPIESELKPNLSPEHKEKLKEYQTLAGDKLLGFRQFYTWYLKNSKGKGKTASVVEDPNIKLIQDVLSKLKQDHASFRILREGYLIKTGRATKGREGPQFKIEAGPKKPPAKKA